MDEQNRKLIAELRKVEALFKGPPRWGYLDAYNIVVPCTLADLLERHDDGDLISFERNRIADDWIDGVRVATIFLALNHDPFSRTPEWFETMVFGRDGKARWCARYETHIEAQQGHAAMVERVKEWLRESQNAG